MRRALVAVMLVPSVASADPTYVAPKSFERPSEASCTTIEKVYDGKVNATYRLWVDAKGRPTFLERSSDTPWAYAYTYDADGWLVRSQVEIDGSVMDTSFRYGTKGELLEETAHTKTGPTVQTPFTWTGTFGDKIAPPSYARAIPLLIQNPMHPGIAPNEVYDAPHFTGTVKDDDGGRWTVDEAKRSVSYTRGNDHRDVVLAATKGGFTRTDKSDGETKVETWADGHIVSWSTELHGGKAGSTYSYDAKGRWTEAKSTGFLPSFKVTYTCK